jgi:hypothetical protein
LLLFFKKEGSFFGFSMMKLVLFLCVCACPAVAAPRLVPTRDVTVTYSVHPRDHAPLEVNVSIEAGGGRLRITAEDLPTAFLVDRRERVATILLPMLKIFTTVKIGDYDPQETVLRGAHYERHGSEVIAGRQCTDWTAVSPKGSAAACITEDGVILGGHAADRHGELGAVRASLVRYGQLPEGVFERPEGFTSAGNLPIEGFLRSAH